LAGALAAVEAELEEDDEEEDEDEEDAADFGELGDFEVNGDVIDARRERGESTVVDAIGCD
jgi:hypothetical protein